MARSSRKEMPEVGFVFVAFGVVFIFFIDMVAIGVMWVVIGLSFLSTGRRRRR